MTITTITIPVDSELARKYYAASVDDQKKFQAYWAMLLLLDAALGEIDLNELMDTISDRAESHGLTPDILESLLGDNE